MALKRLTIVLYRQFTIVVVGGFISIGFLISGDVL